MKKLKYLFSLLVCVLCTVNALAAVDLRSNVVSVNSVNATVSFSSSSSYEWEWDSSTSRLRSTNDGKDNTVSETTITISVDRLTDIAFSYIVSGEVTYDKYTILLDGTTTIADGISGSASKTYAGQLTAGEHTLKLSYSKDQSTMQGTEGDDRAYFFDLKLTTGTVSVTGVTVNPTTQTIAVGGTTQLQETVLPSDATNKNVTWYSSNESVATVSSTGLVTAVAPGTATITVKTNNNITATCEITVPKPDNRPLLVTRNDVNAVVSFSNSGNYEWDWYDAKNKLSSTNVDVDNTTSESTITITTSKTSDFSFKYQVSSEEGYDKFYMTLDGVSLVSGASGEKEGAINKSLSSGTHTLVVKYVKNTNLYSGFDRAFIYDMQFLTSGAAPTSVTLDKSEATLNAGGSVSLTATVAPNTATDKTVTWTTSNTTVATVDASGKVTAVVAGKATITATTSNGLTATCDVTVEPSGNVSDVITNNTAGATVTFFVSGDAYKWAWDSTNKRMYSNNKGTAKSHSQATITIEATKPTVLSFSYAVSSEVKDKLHVYLDGTTETDKIVAGKSGTVALTEVSVPLSQGKHTLKLQYSKDASGNGGDDRAYFSDMQLKPLSLQLTDANQTVVAGTYAAGMVSYERAITADKYATFCLPFDVALSETTDYFDKVYTFAGYCMRNPDTGMIRLMLTISKTTDVIPAGTPFIAHCIDTRDLTLYNANEVTYTSPLSSPTPKSLTVYDNNGTSTLYQNTDVTVNVGGFYAKTEGLNSDNYRAFSSDGTFGPASWLNPFRVYIYKGGDSSSAKVSEIIIDLPGIETTEEKELTLTPTAIQTDKVYNLQGQQVRMGQIGKGLYIVNGKKYLLK